MGEIITTAQLPPDDPCEMTCGDCGRCVQACPSGALSNEGAIDCSRCLSCLLIENHEESLPAWVKEIMKNRVVGCDDCQLCCPHNANAPTSEVEDFFPTEAVMTLSRQRVEAMTSGEFKRTFSHSAISRLRYKTLKRNAALTDSQKNNH